MVMRICNVLVLRILDLEDIDLIFFMFIKKGLY